MHHLCAYLHCCFCKLSPTLPHPGKSNILACHARTASDACVSAFTTVNRCVSELVQGLESCYNIATTDMAIPHPPVGRWPGASCLFLLYFVMCTVSGLMGALLSRSLGLQGSGHRSSSCRCCCDSGAHAVSLWMSLEPVPSCLYLCTRGHL